MTAVISQPGSRWTQGIQSLCARVLLAWGWKRHLIALAAGACASLAMQPLNFLPAMAVSLTLAVWLIDGAAQTQQPGRRALAWSAGKTGWFYGFGYFVSGLWWVGAAFLVETDEFVWLMPLGVLGLPAGLALFHALGFALAMQLWSPGAARVLALAAGLAASEWLRGHILTGFPWNALGQVFTAHDVLIQSASVFGVEGLTLLTVAICAAPAMIGTGRTRLGRWLAPALALAVLAGLAGFGVSRLQGASQGTVTGAKVRIVQPNVSQRDKIKEGQGQAMLEGLIRLSDRATSPQSTGIADVTHIIWPESPFPFILMREPEAIARIASMLGSGAQLITGAIRTEPGGARGQRPRYFNSIQIIGPRGALIETYDKVHLVPFGEYLPFGGLLDRLGLRQFVKVPGGFEPGVQQRALTVPGLPKFLPLICYEAIFPHEVSRANGDAKLIINVTNDAWFGNTAGPHQHFHQARMRAAEQGIPMLRAANTGISGAIDAYGRVLARTALGRAEVIDTAVPLALESTIFAKHGKLIFPLLLCFMGFTALTLRHL